jgi:hypothetical protein
MQVRLLDLIFQKMCQLMFFKRKQAKKIKANKNQSKQVRMLLNHDKKH